MAIFQSEYLRYNEEHLNDWKNNYWGETLAIYNEILYRYKKLGKPLPDVQLPQGSIPGFNRMNESLIKNVLSGDLAGPHPLDRVADYIEVLVRNLPN